MTLKATVALAAVTVAYAAQVIPHALTKPFWHDEIYTALLSGLPSYGHMWAAGLDAVDLSPPLNLWVTRAVQGGGGAGPLITRLPAALGVYTAIVLVFVILRRRAGLAAATLGALVPFFTAGLRYAAEARGYGLMIGLSAATLYAWMEAPEGRRRALHVPLLGVTLAASLWTHYFGVLVFLPVLAGEAVRLIARRRVDWPVAAAVTFGGATAVPLLPLMRAAAGERATFWSTAVSDEQVVAAYRFLLDPMLSPAFGIAAGLVLIAAVVAVLVPDDTRRPVRRVPAHEAAALTAAVCIPLLAVLLGRFVTGAFVPRYALSAVPGLSVAIPLVLWRIERRWTPLALPACVLLIVLLSWGLVHLRRPVFLDPVAPRTALLDSLRSPGPTVISSSLQFLQLWYYTPPSLRARMHYLADPEEALRRSGSDTIDRGYVSLARWFSVPVQPYDRFVARHTTFRVYAAGSGWLLDRLAESGAQVEQVAADPGGRLYQVTLRP